MFMAVLKSNLFGVTFLFITFNGLCVGVGWWFTDTVITFWILFVAYNFITGIISSFIIIEIIN